jgi:threonine dehydrogenase-like Zn-dependent dehydrogenase
VSSACPRCGSEILPGEVSTRPEAADDEHPGERLEVVRCLCCGTDLSRVAGTEEWRY